MPETGIGLIPDVGGTWLLAHAPGEAGVYLGLTGEAMGAADAIYAALRRRARALGQARRELVERLVDAKGGPVGEAIACAGRGARARRRWPTRRADIDRVFGGATRRGHAGGACGDAGRVGAEDRRRAGAEIAEVPEAHAGRHPQRADAWARSRRRSTSSIRLCVRLFEDGEFLEGVRALLVDKDRKPNGRRRACPTLRPELVAAYLAPLPASEELGLAP